MKKMFQRPRYAPWRLEMYGLKNIWSKINRLPQLCSEITFDEYYICDELGGLKSFRDEDCYDIVIFIDVEVNDDEIRALIKQLLEFKKYR